MNIEQWISNVLSGLMGSVIGAIVSFYAVISQNKHAAKLQEEAFDKQNKITRADFLHKFTESFFSSDCLKLVMLFEYKLITFERKEIPEIGEYLYFDVDKKWIEITNFIDKSVADELKEKYADYEIDNLLGYFEDIGNYKKEDLLDIRMVYEVFGAYIEIIWKNEEIQKYIKIQRDLYGKDMYSGFEYIYNEIAKYKLKSRIQ